jgi:hypothetical protein
MDLGVRHCCFTEGHAQLASQVHLRSDAAHPGGLRRGRDPALEAAQGRGEPADGHRRGARNRRVEAGCAALYYAALNRGRGRPAVEAPEFPLDGAQPDAGDTFELAAEQGDGTRFWVLARVETAKIERWCKVVELPPLRRLEDGKWVEAATGKPLRPLEITVDRSTPC